jgi:hypothetical protein
MPTCSEAYRMTYKKVDKNVQRLESEDNLPINFPRAPGISCSTAIPRDYDIV